MRIIRLYTPHALALGDELQLEDDIRHYAINVLRLKKSSTLILFNGDGFDYCCEILHCSKTEIVVKPTKRNSLQTESSLTTHLYLGISKSLHMDFAMQKTVEAGVSVIQPVFMERTVNKANRKSMENKHQHWTRIIQSASEQCGRAVVPELQETCCVEDIEEIDNHEHGILFDPSAEHSFKALQNIKTDNIKLMVGPEGGITENEIKLLVSKNFNPVRCGPRILRTETAALTAVLMVQWLYGDLKL